MVTSYLHKNLWVIPNTGLFHKNWYSTPTPLTFAWFQCCYVSCPSSVDHISRGSIQSLSLVRVFRVLSEPTINICADSRIPCNESRISPASPLPLFACKLLHHPVTAALGPRGQVGPRAFLTTKHAHPPHEFLRSCPLHLLIKILVISKEVRLHPWVSSP